MENLFSGWKKFKKGKKNKSDVLAFSFNLEDNIFTLQDNLHKGVWRPDPYTSFFISDPKLRHIHKASVRDRVLYHAVHRTLYPIFDNNFIFDSYASRVGKGTHTAVKRLETFARKLSKNYTRQIYCLKCDIKKFFDSVDHEILMQLLNVAVTDKDVQNLTRKIISSFHKEKGKGLPLGNVTSQLFANVYLNPLDWFVKSHLRIKYYIRYCDDFVILSPNPSILTFYLEELHKFLRETLSLKLHRDKIIMRKFTHGIDFLGYVILPHYTVFRTKTKKRMLRKIRNTIYISEDNEYRKHLVASYLGLLSHCKGKKLIETISEFQKT